MERLVRRNKGQKPRGPTSECERATFSTGVARRAVNFLPHIVKRLYEEPYILRIRLPIF